MADTKKEEQNSGSIDERLAKMESESIKFPNPNATSSQDSKPAPEEKKTEPVSTPTPVPTVIGEGTSQMEALKENKPVLAFVAGLIIGALIVWIM